LHSDRRATGASVSLWPPWAMLSCYRMPATTLRRLACWSVTAMRLRVVGMRAQP
jgi:hypothetical protein